MTTSKAGGFSRRNKSFAEKWLEFIKTGIVTDATPPLKSPYNIVARTKGNGIVISWEADADIESGIKGFKIYRNSNVIHTDSIQSKWNFQIDYHDNPKELHDKFEFTDRNIHKNKEYRYQVSLINQEGLESTKSEAIVIKKD